ncbi:MAG: hypothetical protein AAB472_01430 [Patescibacteria group bacterium]
METRRVHEVVHGLRQKPEHVRERIALLTAAGSTLVVALGWFGVMSTTGAFSLAPNLPASDIAQTKSSVTDETNFKALLGAAGAAMGATSTAPNIKVVDTKSYSTLDAPTPPQDQTVIHF